MKLALAGDTMLGRAVGEAIERRSAASVVHPGVIEAIGDHDLFVLNLECCISTRGERWPDPRKPFFFRGPPQAVEVLTGLGVDCVTLANNHALDYGYEALADTLEYLAAAGIVAVGAGENEQAARRPKTLEVGGFRLRIVAFADHPADFAAGPDSPGISYVDLSHRLPDWVRMAVSASPDPVLVTPHWGPNMTEEPVPSVLRAAQALRDAGATLVAGHSAHVFHGIAERVIYDMGDFVDDYAVDPRLRNDLGLVFMVDLTPSGPRRIEAIPIVLEFCHTRLAVDDEVDWIERRLRRACGAMGTDVTRVGDRFLVETA
ncbi:MAG TPA: CapA family protein [Acidimicrobiia bacterium]|jgi:poly-gamma-glutamate capsule biosynthesis protein CapA/YwtB (metallophosphatase superfamily)